MDISAQQTCAALKSLSSQCEQMTLHIPCDDFIFQTALGEPLTIMKTHTGVLVTGGQEQSVVP